jgi:hypothetical protein
MEDSLMNPAAAGRGRRNHENVFARRTKWRTIITGKSLDGEQLSQIASPLKSIVKP